jgi:5-methylcytosine-specific restriction endonuclease McrA
MKIQMNDKQKSLHERAVYLSHRAATMEFSRVENLIEIEAHGVHKAFGKRMFTYATEILEMDPAVAYSYIALARACVKFASLRVALSSGALSVSKASRIVSCLSEEMIEFAKTHSKREIEEEVGRHNPKAGVRDRVRPLNSEFDELKVRLQKSVSKNLARARALNPSCDLPQTIAVLIEFYLERKDPVRKAERNRKAPKSKKFSPGRKPLSAEERHAVNIRDRGCCTFVGPDGKRCGSDRWTEIHHIHPVHLGGTNDPENLTTLCSFHHDLVHQLTLPMDGQVTWFR